MAPDALGADAKAFNRLLIEASSRNMPVFLPPGIYRLSDIELPDNTRISGIPGATRLAYSGEGRFMRAVGVKQVALTDLSEGDAVIRYIREQLVEFRRRHVR